MPRTTLKTDMESHLLDLASSHALGSFPIDHLFTFSFSRSKGFQFSHLGTASRVELRGLVSELHDFLMELEEDILERSDSDEHPCPAD